MLGSGYLEGGGTQSQETSSASNRRPPTPAAAQSDASLRHFLGRTNIVERLTVLVSARRLHAQEHDAVLGALGSALEGGAKREEQRL